MEAVIDPQTERQLAVKLYNHCWSLIRGGERTAEQDDELERAAFTSLYHWSKVGNATNLAIGEWMIAHVYLVLGRLPEAARFAQRVIDLCTREGFADFYLAYGHLETARILRAMGKPDEAQVEADKAKAIPIAEEDDREIFEKDVAAENW